MALVCVLGAAGCGAASHHHGKPRVLPAAHAGTSLTTSAPASLRAGELAQVGVTQRVDTRGAELSVTLRSVLDPLRDSGSVLPKGTHAVGVIVQIRSAGPRIYDSSATGDISLVVSSGDAMPVLATRGVCTTPLNDFDRYITAGEDRVGCVVFAVPDGAALDAVQFSPHAQAAGRLVWAP